MELRKISLRQLVQEVHEGKVVLPDFQRSFIWEPDDVRELLISVIGGYYIGTMLMLEYNQQVATRLIEGVEKVNKDPAGPPEKILLDGQQRTTALYYALYKPPDLPLKDKSNPFTFYLDVQKALEEEYDEAVFGISESDKGRYRRRVEGKEMVIEFSLLMDEKKFEDKFKGHKDFEKINEIRKNFIEYGINIIYLPKDTDLGKILETFERINRTGVPLSTFDILTARLYKHNVNLRDLLEEIKEDKSKKKEKKKHKYEFVKFVPDAILGEFIIKVIALIRGSDLRKRTLIQLEPKEFEDDWYRACDALEEAYRRVREEYGVYNFKKWMPYSTMLVPLAAMLDYIRNKDLDRPESYEKIDRWYWTSVFSNRYDQAVNSVSTEDYEKITNWISGGDEPEFIKNFEPKSVDLFNAKSQNSAIYKGVINLIALQKPLDFKKGQRYILHPDKIQIDHIFPKSVFIDKNVLNVTNVTIITSNQQKSNKAPSEFFKEIKKELGEKKLKQILKSHIIPEDAIDDLLKDNLEGFLEKRRREIIKVIEEKTKGS